MVRVGQLASTWAARCAGLFLLLAAVGKWLAFVTYASDKDSSLGGLPPGVVWGLMVFEIILGAGAIGVPATLGQRMSCILATLLVLGGVVHSAWLVLHHELKRCGCFGNLAASVRSEAILRGCLLLCLSVALMASSGATRGHPRE